MGSYRWKSVNIYNSDKDEEIVDLFAAQTGQLRAWLDYLLNEKLDGVSTILRKRLQLEVMRRILDPNFERTDFAWMRFTGG